MSAQWQAVQDAATEHLQASGHTGFHVLRELDGLAIGVECAMCSGSWWRAGYERFAATTASRPGRCDHGEPTANCDQCAVIGEIDGPADSFA